MRSLRSSTNSLSQQPCPLPARVNLRCGEDAIHACIRFWVCGNGFEGYGVGDGFLWKWDVSVGNERDMVTPTVTDAFGIAEM